jgi:hypothetical protein
MTAHTATPTWGFPVRHLHAKTIRTLAVQQRLLGEIHLWVLWPEITKNPIMARIRITQEAMEDLAGLYPFKDAARAEIAGLMHDVATDSWVKTP